MLRGKRPNFERKPYQQNKEYYQRILIACNKLYKAFNDDTEIEEYKNVNNFAFQQIIKFTELLFNYLKDKHPANFGKYSPLYKKMALTRSTIKINFLDESINEPIRFFDNQRKFIYYIDNCLQFLKFFINLEIENKIFQYILLVYENLRNFVDFISKHLKNLFSKDVRPQFILIKNKLILEYDEIENLDFQGTIPDFNINLNFAVNKFFNKLNETYDILYLKLNYNESAKNKIRDEFYSYKESIKNLLLTKNTFTVENLRILVKYFENYLFLVKKFHDVEIDSDFYKKIIISYDYLEKFSALIPIFINSDIQNEDIIFFLKTIDNIILDSAWFLHLKREHALAKEYISAKELLDNYDCYVFDLESRKNRFLTKEINQSNKEDEHQSRKRHRDSDNHSERSKKFKSKDGSSCWKPNFSFDADKEEKTKYSPDYSTSSSYTP